jgi:uncharacterized protein (TIGR02996 family)
MTTLYGRPEVLAFLRDAKDHPEDDTPRLALADWLDEQGDPDRAAFLRLRCRFAPDSPWPLRPPERDGAAERVRQLLARFGGGWLGPLWPRGGCWHRGLLAAHLDRRVGPAQLQDVLPWMDSLLFEATGREAFGRLAELLAAGQFNHVTLALRRPFGEDNLLALLGAIREVPSLRTLSLCWPPGMARHGEGGVVPALSNDFFAHLVGRLPVGRHLTHLGSTWPLAPGQAGWLRAAGIAAVLTHGDPHWPHALPPASFRRPNRAERA